ncbi:MAG: hypothetical protein Q9207_008529 [Kuettlingeria erythrocarpa]
MDLWQGHIECGDGQPQVQDIHLSHPHVQKILLPRDASLHFLTIIEARKVPFYLAAGPSLDVWTSVESTQEWLHQCLSENAVDDKNEEKNKEESGRSWWGTSGRRSRHGILLGVKGDHGQTGKTGPTITEVLLYAAATKSPQHLYAPPSPPAWSSPGKEGHLSTEESSLRLFALPLSSKILEDLEQIPEDPRVALKLSDDGFYYLPTPPNCQPSLQDYHAPKRPKIETLFNDAAQNRRQQKKRGGEGMAKAMAEMGNNLAMPALPSPALPQPVQTKARRPAASAGRAQLSRALTTGSVVSLSDIQPVPRASDSRRSTITNGQRSSLHRVTSALSPAIQNNSSPVPEDGNDIEKQNKNVLSRIVMTGMRVYGFQPQRKKSISNLADTQSQLLASLDGSTSIGADGRQDEYKAVYHQTFKATSFVFRKCWADKLVSQDLLRDTVDSFLGKFCQDPFAELTFDASFGGGGDLGSSQKSQ